MRALVGADAGLPVEIEGTIATVGTFDGVHRGHREVLERLVSRAREVRLPSLLITFDSHPLELINPSAAPPLLTSGQDKLELIGVTGLQFLVVLPFTRELADLSAEQFVDLVLMERFRMRELLIGHDHGFGRGRQGDVETLCALGTSRGFRVDVVPPVTGYDGEAVSSTAIRRAIAAGELGTATCALGRPHLVSGRVGKGDGRGRSLGFPTLNVEPESSRLLLPPDGVYAVVVATSRGRFQGMLNLGSRPTFDDERRLLEVHLFDAEGDFYGDRVQVGIVARLRDTVRFAGPAALIAQLVEDERAARLALTIPDDPGNLEGSTPVSPSTA